MGYRSICLFMVGLILNLKSVSIIPQYHVVYDYITLVYINEIKDYLDKYIKLISSPNSRLQVFLEQEEIPFIHYDFLIEYG